MHCNTHPDVEAIRSCHACLKPLCKECSQEVMGSFFCEGCLAERLALGQPEAAAAEPARARLKIPFLAGFLSLVPGLGQVYVGLVMRGVAHFVILIVIARLADAARGVEGLFILGFIAYYFWQIFDAVGSARDVNRLGRLPDPEEARAMGRGPLPCADRGSRRFGIILIVVGALLALQNMGFTGWLGPMIATWWPLAVIAVGAWLLHRSRVDAEEARRAERLDFEAATASASPGGAGARSATWENEQ